MLKNKIMKKTIVSILSIMLMFGVMTVSTKAAESSKGYVIETLDYKESTEDLNFLKEKLDNVDIVGIGEATHFTKEFFQFRHKTIKFLVEQMGYKAILLEAPMGNIEVFNNYIQTGEGDLRSLFKTSNWLLASEEIYDTFLWMKEYNENQSKENKIRLYGMDVRTTSNSDSLVVQYISKVNESLGSELGKLLPKEQGSMIGTDVSRKIYESGLAELRDNKDKYIKETSIEEYEFNLRHLDIINKGIDIQMLVLSEKLTTEERDTGIFEQVKWINEYEKKNYSNNKLIVSAHNGHITKEFTEVVLGNKLAAHYGEKYYAIGVDFYNGSFVTQNPVTGIAKTILNESDPDSFASKVKAFGKDMLFFDVDESLKNNELKELMSAPQNMYIFGAAIEGVDYKRQNVYKFNIEKSFDGIFYIQTTTAGTLFNTIFTGND
ncbi:MAG: erythromycin esterase family protein, partial [Clostridium sp.]